MAFNATTDDRFVFIDLETTGLKPKGGLILEAAIVLTDSNLKWLDAINVVVPHKASSMLAAMDDFAKDMHTKNGLLDEINDLNLISGESEVTHTILDAEVLSFLNGHGISGIPMAGSSVAFDRAWINEHLPLSASLFHYRNIDVSSMLEAIKRINPKMVPNVPQVGTAHRAMGDILTTIETLRVISKISGWSYAV